MSISDCDVNAIFKVNRWKLVDDKDNPYGIQEDKIYC